MIPNSAADRRFLAERRDTVWADWCEADVMRRIWGITTWSDTVIEEIACRSFICRVVVNMPTPGVLASLYTNIVIHHLYGDGVTPLEWNELAAPHGRSRAVFYLEYQRPNGLNARALNSRMVPRTPRPAPRPAPRVMLHAEHLERLISDRISDTATPT